MCARAATAGELANFRADNQWSELYLAIHKPPVVFAALLNGAPDSNDNVTQINYDGVSSGAYTDILVGMTCYVGTSAGGYDLGMARIRYAPTDTLLYIGQTSEIAWADNCYLTVVDEFGLWARHIYAPSLSVVKVDWNVGYSDQHKNPDPTPVLGPDAVLWLTGTTVTFSPTAASSWVVGGTITAYSWAAPGASTTANLTTATPTITYNAAGTYRVSCAVTASNGKTFTGYRTVFVYSAASMPVTAFTLDNCAGDHESGGWSFTVTMYDQAAQADVRDRAKVVLFAKDYYNGTLGSIGPLAGYENIIATGWIDGESIEYDGNLSQVRFTVRGASFWLDKITGFPTGIRDKNAADPTDWYHFRDLTVDKGLWHFLHWRSTASAIMDITLSGDTRVIQAVDVAVGSLWQQITSIAMQYILARPVCDRYGRMFVEIDTQYVTVASRAAFPTVQAVASNDWQERVGIERVPAAPVALLEANGSHFNGTKHLLYFSKAPGSIFKAFGLTDAVQNMAVTDQAQLNEIAGLLLAQRNNEYPLVSLTLAENNRLLDICPRQYVTLSLAAADTPRGIVWTNKKFLVRRVEFEHDPESGALSTRLELEAETSGPAGQTYIPPQPPKKNIPLVPVDPIFPIFPPSDPYFPPVVPPPLDIGDCKSNPSAEANGPYTLYFSPSELAPGDEAYAQCPVWIRVAGASFGTVVQINLDLVCSISDLHLYGVDANHNQLAAAGTGELLMSGTYAFEFAPEPGVSVEGFLLTVDAAAAAEYSKGAQLSSGALSGGPDGRTPYHLTGLTVGNWYCIESSGGPIYQDGDLKYASYYIKADLDASMAGAMGTLNGGWIDNVPPWISYAERVLPNYYRFFWRATQTGLYLWAGDESFGDNPGGYFLSFALYEANVRALTNSGANLFNVCDP